MSKKLSINQATTEEVASVFDNAEVRRIILGKYKLGDTKYVLA